MPQNNFLASKLLIMWKKINFFSDHVLHKNMLVVWVLPWWYFNYSLGTCFFISSLHSAPFHLFPILTKKNLFYLLCIFSIPHSISRKLYFAQSVIKCDKKWVKKITYVLRVQKIKWKREKHYQFCMVCFSQSRGKCTQSTIYTIDLHP